MPWPRAGIVVAVIGFVLLAAGWWLASVGSAGPARPAGPAEAVGSVHVAAWRDLPPAANASLMQQLQQFLAGSAGPFQPQHPRAVPHASTAPSVQGSVCFVAGGPCSIHPCVVPVAAAPRPVCSAAAPPVRAVPVSRP